MNAALEPTSAGLTALRESAATLFAALPWPKTEDEAWRRTDLGFLDPERFDPAAPAGMSDFNHADVLDFDRPEERLGEMICSGNGMLRRWSKELEARGVHFCDLATAMAHYPEKVFPSLGRVVPPESGKFAAWNTAHLTSGIFLYVPRGVVLSQPILGGFGFGSSTGRAFFPRTLVVLEEGAQTTYIEDHTARAAEGENLSNGVVEFVVGAGAKLNYVHLQRWPKNWWHFSKQNAWVRRDGELNTMVIATGAGTSRADFGSDLLETGAAGRLYGLVFGDEEQRFTHHTHQDHRAPHTSSDLLFKAALRDNARSVYTGMIKIAKEAQKTNAYQASKNILLSKGARANAIPMLEILADDVKCGHGAAVGSLDDDQRFYLMSRGLPREEAERAIVEGFFEDVLQRIPVPGMSDRLRAVLDAKLEAPRG